MKALLEKIRKILRNRRIRTALTRMVSVTAAFVVFVTTYALVLPAITLEKEAYCGIEEHQHDDSCYRDKLVCTLPECEGHHHTEACYTVSKVLKCDIEEHQHGESCYDNEGNLTCGKEEHKHDDSCYEEQRELTCGLEESEGHQHDSSCYEKELICGKVAHVHSVECYQKESSAVAASGDTSAGAVFAADDEISGEDGYYAETSDTGADEYEENGEDSSAESDDNEYVEDGESSDLDVENDGIEDTDADDEVSVDGDVENGDDNIQDAEGDGFEEINADDEVSVDGDVENGDDNIQDAELDGSEDINVDDEVSVGGDVENGDEIIQDAELDGSEDIDTDVEGNDDPDDVIDDGAEDTEIDDSWNDSDEAPVNSEENDGDGSGDELSDSEDSDTADYSSESGSSDDDLTADEDGAESEATENENTGAEAGTGEDTTAATAEAAENENTGVETGTGEDITAAAAEAAENENTGAEAGIGTGEETTAAAAEAAENENTGAEAGTGEDTTASAAEAADEYTDTEALSGGYVPELESIDFNRVIDKQTGFYYFHADEGQEVPESSAGITDWKKVKNGLLGDTILAPTDLVKMYLSYTIPAGILNETNQTARYRLPSNIHLTDDQINAINETVNGVAAQYTEQANADTDTADKDSDSASDSVTGSASDPEATAAGDGYDETDSTAEYQKYLGAEAVEGDRKPDETLKEGRQEYISAIVKAENVFDEEGVYGEKGAYLGQDLIFIFTPYSIEKNQRTYDTEGNPVSAGEKITGWFACDFNMSQIDWVQEEQDLDSSTIEKTADVVFVEEDSESGTKEISTLLKMVESGDVEKNAGADIADEKAEAASAATDPGSEEIQEDGASAGVTAAEDASFEKTASAEDDPDRETVETAATRQTSETAAAGLTSEAAEAADSASLAKEEDNPVYKSGTLTADGDGYKITLDYTEKAKIPENAGLSVKEITVETDKEAYEACLEQAGQQVAADDKTSVDEKASRFFDIEIIVKENGGDGKESIRKIEPAAPVKVNIQIFNTSESEGDKSGITAAAGENGQSDPTVLHFAEEGVEQIDSVSNDNSIQSDSHVRGNGDEQGTEILFEAESFSVYGVVYTVDFHWEVDGKEYEFSLAGGDSVSFRSLVKVLHILDGSANAVNEDSDEEMKASEGETEGDGAETKDFSVTEEDINKFIEDIKSIEFSTPALVWSGKLQKEMTAGQIAEENGLEVEYSGELDADQIKALEDRAYVSGEWVLMGVKPFTSTEKFTVTLKTDEVFEIKVTDAQIYRRFLTADGQTYDITVIYEDDAQIPDGADLNVREITPDTTDYQKYLKKSAEQLGEDSVLDISYARFFDIEIVDSDGKKIEPKAPVLVNIDYAETDAAEIKAAKDVHVVHFADDGTEVIDEVAVNQEGTVMSYLQDGFSVTGTVVNNPAANDQYMVLIEYEGNYYIVNNDGSLTNVGEVNSAGTVEVDEPMMWTYDGKNIYHHSEQVSFNNSQVAADFYNKYIDPTDTVDGISKDQDNSGTTLKDVKEQYFDWNTWSMKTFTYQVIQNRPQQGVTQLTLTGDNKIKSANSEQYLGVVEEDGVLRLVGGVSAADAATVRLATANEVLKTNYLNHTVNHIDISIQGDSTVNVPLAYGTYKYYDANGNLQEMTIDSPKTLELNSGVVGITMDDMKRAIITAYKKNEDGSTTELDDAFVVSGYSANSPTAYSTQQVRIEGDFRVSYMDPVTQTYYNQHTSEVWAERLKKIIYYKVTAYKTITFNLIDPDYGQLYDENGNPLSVSVDVAFSASFNYWDQANECPPVRWDQDWLAGKGTIPTHNLSGMDFVLGGNGDGSATSRAVEVKKIIEDENGSPIELKSSIDHSFELYYYPDTTSASNPAGNNTNLRNDSKIWNMDSDAYADYKAWEDTDHKFVHAQNIGVRVGTSGMGQSYTYDYNSGMFYIKEDTSKVSDVITDADGEKWYYASTVIETEYVRRYAGYDTVNGSKNTHKSDTYTEKDTESYYSRAEVLGNYLNQNDSSTTVPEKDLNPDNEFLEFTVHNVYRNTKAETTDLNVTKEWKDNQDEGVQEVYVKVFRKTENGDPEDFTNVIKNDKDNLNLYIDNAHFDVNNGWIVVGKTDSTWDTVTLKDVPITTETDPAETYTYYIQEVGYKDADGNVRTNVDHFDPQYETQKTTDTEWQTMPETGIALEQKTGDGTVNQFKVINAKEEPKKTSYTVTKTFSNNSYPSDGSVQVIVGLEEGYLQAGETVPSNWKDAGAAVVSLPKAKPTDNASSDEDWYTSTDAWTYTWEDLNATRKVNDTETALWYRVKEISTPGWFSAPEIDKPNGEQVTAQTDDNAPAIAAQKSTITNSPAVYDLTVDKKWAKDGKETSDWPENATVETKVVQYWHLAEADTSTNPATLKAGAAFHSEELEGQGYTYTLRSGDTSHIFNNLNSYGYLSGEETTDALIVEARKAGVSLDKEKTYLVIYTYGAKETNVTWSDGTSSALNIESEGEQNGTSFTSSFTNELTDLTVKKQWRESGEQTDTTWPEGASVNYIIMRTPVYTTDAGREISFESEEYLKSDSTGYKGAITASNFETGVSYTNLPKMGVKTLPSGNTYGLVAGNYLVSYRYYVVEDPDSSTAPLDSGYAYTQLAADVINGVATLTNEYTELTVEKKWVKKNSSGAEIPATFPAGFKVNWKVVQKDSDGNVINADFYKGYDASVSGKADHRLTADNTSYVLHYLPAKGMKDGKEVTYTYEVYEEVEGSEAPENQYLFQTIEALEGTGENAGKFTITNDLTNVTVKKVGDQGSKVVVQLYATTSEPNSLKTVDVTVQLDQWTDGDALTEGTVTGKLKADGTEVKTISLTPTAWKQTFANLPKYNSDGTEITYTVEITDGPSANGTAEVYSTTTSDDNITFHLKAKGEENNTVKYTFTRGNNWPASGDWQVNIQVWKAATNGTVDYNDSSNRKMDNNLTISGGTVSTADLPVGNYVIRYQFSGTHSGYEFTESETDGWVYSTRNNEEGEQTIPINLTTGSSEDEFAVTVNIIGWKQYSGNTSRDPLESGTITVNFKKNGSDSVYKTVTLSGSEWNSETVYLTKMKDQYTTQGYQVSCTYSDSITAVEISPNYITYSNDAVNLTVVLPDLTTTQSMSKNSTTKLLNASPMLLGANPDVTVTAPDDESAVVTEAHKLTIVDKSNLPEGAVAVGGEVTLDDTNTPTAWQYTWDNLPAKDADGNDIYYYVVEKEAWATGNTASTTATYQMERDEATGNTTIIITNTTTEEKPKTGTIEVEKKLEGVVNSAKPFKFSFKDAVTGEYLAPGSNESTDYGWRDTEYLYEITPGQKYIFTNLVVGNYVLKESISGDEVVGYVLDSGNSVTGTASSGISVTADATSSFTFKNVYNPAPIRVTKQWKKGDEIIAAPSGATVKFQLYKTDTTDSNKIGEPVELDGVIDDSEPTAWVAEWKDLPRQTEDGTEITYIVKEVTDDNDFGWENYKVTDTDGITYNDSSEDSNVITNQETTTEINVTKIWYENDGKTLKTDKTQIGYTLYQTYTDNKGNTHSAVYTFAKQKVGEGTESDLTDGHGNVNYVSGTWETVTLSNLPTKVQGDDGTWYDARYYVEEDGIANVSAVYRLNEAGASDKPQDAAAAEGTITIINTDDATSLKVEKSWDDLAPNTPYTITFKLQSKAPAADETAWTELAGTYTMTFNGTGYTITKTEDEQEDVTYISNIIQPLEAGKQYRAVETSYKVTDTDGSTLIEKTFENESVVIGTSVTADNGKSWTSRLANELSKIAEIGGTKTWDDGKASHANPTLILERKIEGENWDNAEKVTALKTDSTTPAAAPATEEVDTDGSAYTWLQPVWKGRSYSYTNLPKYNPQGKEYTYRVTEASIPGYNPTYSTENGVAAPASDTGKAVVDIENAAVGKLKVKKVWFAGAKTEDMETIYFKLEKSYSEDGPWEAVTTDGTDNKGNVVSTDEGVIMLGPQMEVDEEGNDTTVTAKTWEWTSADLPRYEKVGDTYKEVFYRVYETRIGDSNVVYTGSDDYLNGTELNWKVTNPEPTVLAVGSDTAATINNDREYLSVSGTKTWVTKDPSKIPETLELKLYKWIETTDPDTKEVTKSDETLVTVVDGNSVQGSTEPTLTWYKPEDNPTVWTYAYTYLPKSGTPNVEYRYRVEEVLKDESQNIDLTDDFEGEMIPGQTTEKGDITNWNFINTEKTSIKVIKKWLVNEVEVEGDPFIDNREVQIELFRKGGATTTSLGVHTMTKSTDPDATDKWVLEIKDLPKYYRDAEGELQDYSYYVIEQDPGTWHVEYYMDDVSKSDKTNAPNRMDAKGSETPIFVENSTFTTELPSSGDSGTKMFYILGALITLMAAGILLSRRLN